MIRSVRWGQREHPRDLQFTYNRVELTVSIGPERGGGVLLEGVFCVCVYVLVGGQSLWCVCLMQGCQPGEEQRARRGEGGG